MILLWMLLRRGRGGDYERLQKYQLLHLTLHLSAAWMAKGRFCVAICHIPPPAELYLQLDSRCHPRLHGLMLLLQPLLLPVRVLLRVAPPWPWGMQLLCSLLQMPA